MKYISERTGLVFTIKILLYYYVVTKCLSEFSIIIHFGQDLLMYKALVCLEIGTQSEAPYRSYLSFRARSRCNTIAVKKTQSFSICTSNFRNLLGDLVWKKSNSCTHHLGTERLSNITGSFGQIVTAGQTKEIIC